MANPSDPNRVDKRSDWYATYSAAITVPGYLANHVYFENPGRQLRAHQHAAGLHNPGCPIARPDFGSALIAVGAWQAVFFIAWYGWPARTITRGPLRLLAALALNRALAAHADSCTGPGPPPTTGLPPAALSFVGADIILHTGIDLRWPFT